MFTHCQNYPAFKRELKQELNQTISEDKYKQIYEIFYYGYEFSHFDRMVKIDNIINKGRKNKNGCIDNDIIVKILHSSAQKEI